MQPPAISVIIPTFNRARLLTDSLESLVRQSVARDQFEVVVVDDGSLDDIGRLCATFADRLRLTYRRIANSGISAAKNLGIFTATGRLLFFFDDDDVAHPELLAEHLRAHELYPENNVAVLGYTAWAPTLTVTEVMRYVTDVGQFLFAYQGLTDGQELDFTYFWGGRSSCKRSLLVRHAVFCQEFRFGCEDIELGYRLTRHGLKVRFHQRGVQYMNRPITFDEFCRRCEKQGRSQVYFSRLHGSDRTIRRYCRLDGAEEKWREATEVLPGKIGRVREIERHIATSRASPEGKTVAELHGLYRWAFNAFVIKGIIETTHGQKQELASCCQPMTASQLNYRAVQLPEQR